MCIWGLIISGKNWYVQSNSEEFVNGMPSLLIPTWNTDGINGSMILTIMPSCCTEIIVTEPLSGHLSHVKFSINSKCCMWFTLGYIFVTFGYICWLHFSPEKCWLHFSPETSGREVSVTLSLPFGFASPVWNSHTAIVMIIQIYKLFISIFPSLYIYFGLLKPPFAFFFVEPFDSSDWNKWTSSIIQY